MAMKHNHILKKHYTSVHLTDVERASIRTAIHSHIQLHAASIPSPFASFFHVASKPVAAMLIISFIGATTSGMSYAAQSALPDESLYPLKMLTERIETAFAQTSHAQVRVAGEHAIRRIQEATRMHLEGRMTEQHEDTLTESVRGELVRISGVVAEQSSDTPTARESAIVLAKVVGYTNVLTQTAGPAGGGVDTAAARMIAVGAEEQHTSPLVQQIEFFVDTHEDAIAEAVSNDGNIIAEHFISEIGASLLEETPDPLVEATVNAVISSERVMEMFPAEKGKRVLHALADMAEGSASVDVLNAQVDVDSTPLQNI